VRARLPIACKSWRDGESAKSRRHLECRSFKLERRTTTPGSIVPRLGPSFQRWLLLYCRSAPNRRAATFERSFSSACYRRLGTQVGVPPRHAKCVRVGDPGLAVFINRDTACYVSCKNESSLPVVKTWVTSTVNREVAGSNPAIHRCKAMYVAQWQSTNTRSLVPRQGFMTTSVNSRRGPSAPSRML
jgi:hypothetical protein